MFQRDELAHFLLIPLIIGILGGFSAVIFRWVIKLFELLALKIDFGHNNLFVLLIIPPVFVVSNLLVHKVLREHPIISLDAIAKKIILLKGEFSPLRGFLVLLLTSLNIGFGLPVGREAPIAKLGALLGELFLKRLHINRIDWQIHMSSAVGAAISATFNAPLAGIFLGLEIILGRVNLYILTPLVVSSVTATLVAREFLGNFRAFYVPHLPFKDIYFYLLPFEISFISLTALFLIYSLDFFRSLRLQLKRRWYPFVFASGVITSLILIAVPETRGVGYGYISQLFKLHYNFLQTFVIFLAKLYAVILTLGSGLFGGLMSPSIFIGAFGGYTVGDIFAHIFHGVDPRVLALVGSVAMLAGISRAPIRSTIIIIELTHAYQLLLPSLIAAAATSLFVAKFEPGSYFRRSLLQKGLDVDDPRLLEKLKKLDLKKYTVKVPHLYEKTHVSRALKLFGKLHTRYLPVVDKNGKLVGILSIRDLVKLINSPHDAQVREIMSKSPVVLIDGAPVEHTLRVLGMVGTQYVPLVDRENRYLGMVDLQKLFRDLSVELPPRRELIKGENP